MSYTPEHQYRCTIVRGRSQGMMEDMLPHYAEIVHQLCPCTKELFVEGARKRLAKILFKTSEYNTLPNGNKKTINNHLTETAGTLLCLYYYEMDEESGIEYAYETESCKFILDKGDNPAFFKNLCYNMQFPNAAKKRPNVKADVDNRLKIRQLCFVVALLYHAQQQEERVLLSKQEIGYYVLNNLDVLRGAVTPTEVYQRIMYDRQQRIKRPKLQGENEWQHIQEQINLLELANIVEQDNRYLWLNKNESAAIKIFIDNKDKDIFEISGLDVDSADDFKKLITSWRKHYSKVHEAIANLNTPFSSTVVILGREEQSASGTATQSSVDLGDEGEALVYRLEQERVKNYKERLVNKVLLLGKTKGLGYDISSLEADENPEKPEFARYIEVKATKRVTVPSFVDNWTDSLNLTSKEWVAAEQYGEYYNIYRVYFTKSKTIIIRIKNPYKKFMEKEMEVFPTIYQMNFGVNVIEKRYEGE